MAENGYHRYDMRKLRHCHPMYKQVPVRCTGAYRHK